MDRFQNKYQVASARAAWWNYGWVGAYFITICTAYRQHSFGTIQDGVMQLSHVGILADAFWYGIRHHAQQIELGSFVVMPNHIHGLLIQNETHTVDNNPLEFPGQQRWQNQAKNTVSSIIGSYKSAVTKHAHRLGFDFEWQRSFHDHIIRSDADYQRINDYIESNPENWNEDRFFCDSE